MNSKIGFIWHRFYRFDCPISGLCCEVVSDETEDHLDFEGLKVPKEIKFYWFHAKSLEIGSGGMEGQVRISSYQAFRLNKEELVQLDLERRYHESSLGFSINHTSRRISNSAYGEFPSELLNFEPCEAHKEDMKNFPKDGTIKPVFNATLDLSPDKEAFIFSEKDVVNFQPGSGDLL